MPGKWMDQFEAPLHACSLETIHEPVQLADGGLVWPTMLGCYQLTEHGQRVGQLNLYMVQVPDISSNHPSLPLKFGAPHTVLHPETCSGILDGKWSTRPDGQHVYATAHSSGEIRVHALHIDSDPLDKDPLYFVTPLGQSDPMDSICLSLNFGPSRDDLDQQIVSTYANGQVAIHDVVHLENDISLVEHDQWTAHTLFTSPAEVWSAGFCSRQAVLTGGDEGLVKLWDTRATNRPSQVYKDFDAGVTSIAPHPRHEHLVAVGSYDETMAVYDVRLPRPLLYRSHKKLGGGIWRIKWHPITDHRLLVAAMHSGCRVLNLKGFCRYVEQEEDDSLRQQASFFNEHAFVSPTSSNLSEHPNTHYRLGAKSTKKFAEHSSMAYGADWLVARHPLHQQSYFEAAASCSFYDRAVYLWDSVF